MPLPMTIARLNRRGVNRLARRFAGRLPPFALLEHVGRSSGTRYQTPIMVFRREGDFVIALTYGPKTDWVRNVLAVGSARLVYGGRDIVLDAPRLAGWEIGRELPAVVRLALRVFRVRDFLVAVIRA